MSRYDLDEDVYSDLPNRKEGFTILGFIEKEADAKADTFEMVGALDRRDKTIMFRQLAKELGYDISDLSRVEPSDTDEEREGARFDPNAWQSEEFPQRRIRNLDSLIEHVRQEFFCADPVRYQKVLRQIRTSKSPKTIRAYTLGMYVNESDTQICQMCKKPATFIDVTEIANFGIEMPQLNLCLCKNCSSRYKQFRDGNKDAFKEAMTKALRNIDIGSPAEDYEIGLSSEVSVHFTQTHLAEVKEILSLLDQYGIPGSEDAENTENPVRNQSEPKANVTGPLAHPQPERRRVIVVDHRRDGNPRDRYGRPERPVTPGQSSIPERKPADTPPISNRNNTGTQSSQAGTGRLPQTGAAVRHKAFGDGVITYIDSAYVEVNFQRVGMKKFKRSEAFSKGYLTLI